MTLLQYPQPIGGLLAPDWPYTNPRLLSGYVPAGYPASANTVPDPYQPPQQGGGEQGPLPVPPPPSGGGMGGDNGFSVSPNTMLNLGRRAYDLWGGAGAGAGAFPSSAAAASSAATGPGGLLAGGGVTSAGAGTGATGGLSGMFGGGAGAMGSLGPIGAIAALIASGKTIEHNNANNPLGRGLLSMLGPSLNQVKADPKLGLTTLFGLPFLNGFIRNDKAAHAKPEWSFLFGG